MYRSMAVGLVLLAMSLTVSATSLQDQDYVESDEVRFSQLNLSMNYTDNMTGNMTENETNGDVEVREGFPEAFVAFDADGEYLTAIINNQGEVTNVFGSVGDISGLNQESLWGCEYYVDLQNAIRFQQPTDVDCFSYQELSTLVAQGEIQYLTLNASQTENRSGS